MWDALRHSLRLLKIARTLARYDALFPLELLRDAPPALKLVRSLAAMAAPRGAGQDHRRPGERLAEALTDLGPTFIKFGQALATRPDLVGESVAMDLAGLQDRLPPFPSAEAHRTIREELGHDTAGLFAEFDDAPVAAASIAQVHFAVTQDGRKVAVKILRPGVEQRFERDLATFRWLADIIERAQPAVRRLRPRAVVDTLAQTVAMEMDLRYEAAAASELNEDMASNPFFDVPEILWPFTARRVLTLERVDGISLSDRAALIEAGVEVRALAAHVVQAFLEQALFNGFFHADLHQGNLFATPEGVVVAVDFGIMGRLDRKTRRVFAKILYGFLQQDYEGVAEAHFEAGYVPAAESREKFAQALRAIGEPIADKPLKDISLGTLLAQLLKTTETFAMQTQPQLLLLQKTMVMVEGVASHLDPDVNMWEASRPILERWIRTNLGAAARLAEARDFAASIPHRLPAMLEDLEAVAAETRRDGLRLHSDTVEALASALKNRRRSPGPLFLGFLGGVLAVVLVLALFN